MPESPYRDPDREGGWTPWVERLAPAVAARGVWHEFEMGSVGSAKTTAYMLRLKRRPRPPGRWEITTRGSTLRVMYLGPGL